MNTVLVHPEAATPRLRVQKLTSSTRPRRECAFRCSNYLLSVTATYPFTDDSRVARVTQVVGVVRSRNLHESVGQSCLPG